MLIRTNDTLLLDVFDQNTLIAAPDAFSNVTSKTFLGRPWEGQSLVSSPRRHNSFFSLSLDFAK